MGSVRFFFNVDLHWGFVLCRGCVYKHAHDTQTRDNNLWITQRVAPCGNRTRYTLRGSCLVSQCSLQARYAYASTGPHHTQFSLCCTETLTTASTDPHRTDRIIGMRCVLMTSYGMGKMRAMRTMRASGRLP
ncbi:hypothetical protein SFRURICE_000094 [Spodoptera frugiperda]|nr:hypothetical protein SFRURICE_000094 [Spodoptera frugiperda]